MLFNYQPEGTEKPKTWEYDAGRLMSPEAEEIERRTGMRFGEWRQEVHLGSITAQHALLFVLLRRDTPTLKYDEVQFAAGEVWFAYTVKERTNIRHNLRVLAKQGLLDVDGQGLLARYEADDELPDDADDESDEGAEGGDPSLVDERRIGSESGDDNEGKDGTDGA